MTVSNASIREALQAPGGPFTAREIADALGTNTEHVRSVAHRAKIETVQMHERIDMLVARLKALTKPMKRRKT